MANSTFLSRRGFLRGAAGVAVGLPLLESIGGGPLQAQTGSPRRRFLSFHCSSGVNIRTFRPPIGALRPETFQGLGIEPLAPYAERILIPRGIHGYPVGTWTGHTEGTGQALTAARTRGGLADGASIDQIIASELTGREALVLRPGGRDLGVPMFNSISYTGPRQLFAAESDPLRAYRAMMGFGPAAASDGNATQAMDALVNRRQSVLDLVEQELAELNSVDLSRADRLKLDQHAQLIRDIEVRMTGNADLISCTPGGDQIALMEGLDRERVEANENFPVVARLHVQLTALALACGYSRSAVLQWGAAVAGSPMYRWDGMNHNFRHHPLSHGTTDDFNDDRVDGFRELLSEIDRWNMGEFKKLLDLLDGYAEGDGRTLLDNTVTLYTNEFSDGQGHTTGDLPIMLVGGAGHFKLGQSVLVRGSDASAAGVGRGEGNSNKLLCTVLNAVGVPTSRFSDGPEGQLPELLA